MKVTMHLRRKLVAVLAMTVLFPLRGVSQRSEGGELRPPNAQEKPILIHYREVVAKLLNQFRSDDWEETIDYEMTDEVQISNDPDVPLDVDQMSQRSYLIRTGSALYEKEIAPFAAKLSAMKDPNEMASLAKQMKMMNFSVELNFNRAEASLDPPPPGNPDLHVPGAALAYRLKPYKFDKGTSVILLFGNWKAATWNANTGGDRFKFKHSPHQPAIENIVIQLDGSPERIDQLLHGVNWQVVNDALTERP